MKSSASLPNTDNEQRNPNQDTKSNANPDQTAMKQEPVTQPIKQDPISSTTNNAIQVNTIPANLVPITLSPTNTILIPQQQFQISNTSPSSIPISAQTQIINSSNLVPVTTIPIQQPAQQLIAIPASNPTISNNTSALKALQQSLKGRPNPLKLPLPPTAIKQDNTNTNNYSNSRSNSTEQKIKTLQNPPPGLPRHQQQRLLFYPRPQIINPPYDINRNGPSTIKDEKLNENWSAKIAYAATLSSVKYHTKKHSHSPHIKVHGHIIGESLQFQGFHL